MVTLMATAFRDMTDTELEAAAASATSALTKASSALAAIEAERERRKPLITSDTEMIVDRGGGLVTATRRMETSDRGRIVVHPDGSWTRKIDSQRKDS